MGYRVKTKYIIGDKVWYISNNKVQYLEITGVHVLVEQAGDIKVEYILHYESSWVEEEKLFCSKNELLESL